MPRPTFHGPWHPVMASGDYRCSVMRQHFSSEVVALLRGYRLPLCEHTEEVQDEGWFRHQFNQRWRQYIYSNMINVSGP